MRNFCRTNIPCFPLFIYTVYFGKIVFDLVLKQIDIICDFKSDNTRLFRILAPSWTNPGSELLLFPTKKFEEYMFLVASPLSC